MATNLLEGWPSLKDMTPSDRMKLKYLLRHDWNGIVEAGFAVRWGKSWRFNPERLPDFLREYTLQLLAGKSPSRSKRTATRKRPQAKRAAAGAP